MVATKSGRFYLLECLQGITLFLGTWETGSHSIQLNSGVKLGGMEWIILYINYMFYNQIPAFQT